MSSQLQSVVTSIVENNYVTLALLTAIGYDYILTISDEIEYIWNKSWTWVSILFVFIRYFGLCGVIIYTLGTILIIIGEWTMFTFIASADLVMILRVWAIYGRSRIILGVLLTLYALEIIPFIITCAIISTRLEVVTTQVLDFSFCVYDFGPGTPIWVEVRDSLQLAIAAIMCLFVTAKFIWHAFRTYKMRAKWQFSCYLNLFAREGMLYFLAVLLFGLVNVLVQGVKIPVTGWHIIPLVILDYVPVFTLTPRFILSLRALYVRDLRGRCEPYHVDTEFGFTSASGTRSGARGTAIMFAGLSKEGLEEEEDIPMGEWGKPSGF